MSRENYNPLAPQRSTPLGNNFLSLAITVTGFLNDPNAILVTGRNGGANSRGPHTLIGTAAESNWILSMPKDDSRPWIAAPRGADKPWLHAIYNSTQTTAWAVSLAVDGFSVYEFSKQDGRAVNTIKLLAEHSAFRFQNRWSINQTLIFLGTDKNSSSHREIIFVADLISGSKVRQVGSLPEIPSPRGFEQFTQLSVGFSALKQLGNGGFVALLGCYMKPPEQGALTSTCFGIACINRDGSLRNIPRLFGDPFEVWRPTDIAIAPDGHIYVVSERYSRTAPISGRGMLVTKMDSKAETIVWSRIVPAPDSDHNLCPTGIVAKNSALFVTGLLYPISTQVNAGIPVVASFEPSGARRPLPLEGYHKPGEIWSTVKIEADDYYFYLFAYVVGAFGQPLQDHIVIKQYDYYGL